MKLAEILHLCLVSKKTGAVHCQTPRGEAELILDSGEIVDARFDGLRGEEAFYRLSGAPDTDCSLEEKPIQAEKTIHHRTEFLLMEAARLLDEEKKNAAKAEPEAPEEAPRDQYDHELLYVTESEPLRYPLPEGRTSIGRARDCHVQLNNTTVSGHHSEILIRDGQAYLTDLNSSNGTFLNGARVDRSQPMNINDQVQVGACLFEFVQRGSVGTAPPPKSKVSPELQDTRKFVLPTPKPGGSVKPTVPATFKEYQPVNEPGTGPGLPPALLYVLIGLGAGVILVLLIILITRI